MIKTTQWRWPQEVTDILQLGTSRLSWWINYLLSSAHASNAYLSWIAIWVAPLP